MEWERSTKGRTTLTIVRQTSFRRETERATTIQAEKELKKEGSGIARATMKKWGGEGRSDEMGGMRGSEILHNFGMNGNAHIGVEGGDSKLRRQSNDAHCDDDSG